MLLVITVWLRSAVHVQSKTIFKLSSQIFIQLNYEFYDATKISKKKSTILNMSRTLISPKNNVVKIFEKMEKFLYLNKYFNPRRIHWGSTTPHSKFKVRSWLRSGAVWSRTLTIIHFNYSALDLGQRTSALMFCVISVWKWISCGVTLHPSGQFKLENCLSM